MRNATWILGPVLAIVCAAGNAAESTQGPAPAVGAPPAVVVFQNVRIFDGTSNRIQGPSDVLVRGNHIERIAANLAPEPGATVIGGEGRVLMPGLIDMHWHAMLASLPPTVTLAADPNYLALVAGVEARNTLLRGFTTVRDVGGSAFGLKRAIDEGRVLGPRIYPSGATISVTSGHGDFRSGNDLPRQQGAAASRPDLEGHSTIADSPDEVRLRVREQLLRGATQIKLTAGGGVSSPHSPLDAITFTEAEVRAAVEAAGNWGTYVTVHAYTSEAVNEAVAAGVKCIEHGMLMTEDSAKLLASKGIWLSLQPLPEELLNAFPPNSEERRKGEEVIAGVDRTYQLARKYKLKTAWGTDVLFSSALAQQQGALLARLTRWYSPAETLAMATGTNAELLQLSGKRNPYPGELGVVREGALADLLLVNGDPVANIQLITTPETSFEVIMKDGVIYKNILKD